MIPEKSARQFLHPSSPDRSRPELTGGTENLNSRAFGPCLRAMYPGFCKRRDFCKRIAIEMRLQTKNGPWFGETKGREALSCLVPGGDRTGSTATTGSASGEESRSVSSAVRCNLGTLRNFCNKRSINLLLVTFGRQRIFDAADAHAQRRGPSVSSRTTNRRASRLLG